MLTFWGSTSPVSTKLFIHLENKFSYFQENEREPGSIERGYGGQLVERYLTCPIIIKTSFLWISWMVRNEKQSTLNRISSWCRVYRSRRTPLSDKVSSFLYWIYQLDDIFLIFVFWIRLKCASYFFPTTSPSWNGVLLLPLTARKFFSCQNLKKNSQSTMFDLSFSRL